LFPPPLEKPVHRPAFFTSTPFRGMQCHAHFHWLEWAIFLALLYVNWKYALALFAVKFILKALYILETLGNILMWPFKPRRY
jgi:hypothetical protein